VIHGKTLLSSSILDTLVFECFSLPFDGKMKGQVLTCSKSVSMHNTYRTGRL